MKQILKIFNSNSSLKLGKKTNRNLFICNIFIQAISFLKIKISEKNEKIK